MDILPTKHILISAGELSGDLHAANLVRAITKTAPNIKFYGMGSTEMQRSGVDLIVNARDLSFFGCLEIFTGFLKILRAYRKMKRALFKDKPDLLILVDYPGFNLRLAKAAKKAGVKVLYFISPKIWAWHQSRIKIIKNCVDTMAVIFPFEVDFYRKHKVRVKFIGNPLLKMVTNRLPLEEAKKLFNLNPDDKVVGLFPGSRRSEIKRLLPIMIRAAEILKKDDSSLKFLLPKASSISTGMLDPYLQATSLPIQVVTGHNLDVMQVCDAIITASGTATLEIALLEITLVIIYKLSWLEYQIAKRLIKIPFVGLCNILVNQKVVEELLQYDATPEKIAAEVSKILNDQTYHEEMKKNMRMIKKTLENNEKEDISKLVVEMVAGRK